MYTLKRNSAKSNHRAGLNGPDLAKSVCLAALFSFGLTISNTPVSHAAGVKTVTNFNPGHYIIAYRGISARIKSLLEQPRSPFLGVQKWYNWADIEPVEGGPLRLEEIRNDLKYLASKNKFLVIQIQTKDFAAGGGSTVYPAWLRTKKGSPKPGGGFYDCYLIAEPNASHDMLTAKSLPVLWDPAAAFYVKRFYKRFGAALAEMPEARQALECVNINETATAANFKEVSELAAEGKIKPFDQEAFIQNTVECADALHTGLYNGNVIQYLNHSGPWGGTPNRATNRVNEFADRLAARGIGIGCPDLAPEGIGAFNLHETVYPALRRHIGRVVLGVASQPRSYHMYSGGDIAGHIQRVFDMGRRSDGTSATANTLNLNYIFWTNTPDHLDITLNMLNKAGSGWGYQKHRGMVAAPPPSINVFKP